MNQKVLGTPILNWLLIALNALSFLYFVHKGLPWLSPTSADLIRFGADYGPRIARGQWWRPLVSIFLEAGVFQLLADLTALYFLGKLSSLFDTSEFIVIFLLCGLVNSLASAHLNPYNAFCGSSMASFGTYAAAFSYCLARGNLTKFTKRIPVALLVPVLVAVSLYFISNDNPRVWLSPLLMLAAGGAMGFVASFRADRPQSFAVVVSSFCVLVLGLAILLAKTPDPTRITEDVRQDLAHFQAGVTAFNQSIKSGQLKPDELEKVRTVIVALMLEPLTEAEASIALAQATGDRRREGQSKFSQCQSKSACHASSDAASIGCARHQCRAQSTAEEMAVWIVACGQVHPIPSLNSTKTSGLSGRAFLS